MWQWCLVDLLAVAGRAGNAEGRSNRDGGGTGSPCGISLSGAAQNLAVPWLRGLAHALRTGSGRGEMAVPIELNTLAFDPAEARMGLDQLPASPAVFALYGAEAHAEPYIGRTPNLRGRLERLLAALGKASAAAAVGRARAADSLAAHRLGV